ncbi:MAG: DUF362 domain-containing protein [Candidatus Brocadiia bacterium]
MALLAGACLGFAAGPAPAGSVVAVVKGKDVERMVAEALELLGGAEQFVADGQKVVIKPNLVMQPALMRRGRERRRDGRVREEFTTDVRIVAALARQLRRAAQCTVVVAEGTPNDLSELYDFLGYIRLEEQLGIDLVDVDAGPRVAVEVDGLARKRYAMPAITQDSDVLVDVAALKTHHLTGVTLGMKNLFGLLPQPKRAFHPQLDQVLCDLCRMRKPDLVLIDGLVAMEGQGPVRGEPVAMDLLIAGRDIVAVDAVGCAVMGIEPRRIRHLRLAGEQGLGELDLAKIEVRGASIESVRRQFQPALWEAEVRIPRTDARVGRLVATAHRVYRRSPEDDLVMRFESGLQVDTQEYPTREDHGFRVHVPPQGEEILFRVPYKVVFEENGQAAADEMVAWIHNHLGEELSTTKTPYRVPH